MIFLVLVELVESLVSANTKVEEKSTVTGDVTLTSETTNTTTDTSQPATEVPANTSTNHGEGDMELDDNDTNDDNIEQVSAQAPDMASQAETEQNINTITTDSVDGLEPDKTAEVVSSPAVGGAEAAPIVVGSVSDLKVMAKDELPSEDALTAGIEALIAKTKESNAILDQVIRQKKVKVFSQ